MTTTTGLITTSFGRQYIVSTNNGNTYQTVSKGKNTEFVVGDKVDINVINSEQAQITHLYPRNNLIYRSDQNRSKMIASNINQLMIVIAIKPTFNINFLNSCLVAADAENIQPIIILNKSDLPESSEFINKIVDLYHDKLGYQIEIHSSNKHNENLTQLIQNSRSLLIGQSGVGKSTITNWLFPNANARIGDIAKYENSGKHTTTNATLYILDEQTELIDCPGLQEFGLFHIDITVLAEYFPEMREHLGQCKFNNCVHLSEPQCKIVELVNEGKIEQSRYIFYKNLCSRLKTKKSY
ncbi:MAG: ribosome small subunit-dependent GTPase A [Neisseriaceae bacterium]|nr:MAG: ribosome small subunit-dependent GTPase A [Neisseriaceae bacterium]